MGSKTVTSRRRWISAVRLVLGTTLVGLGLVTALLAATFVATGIPKDRNTSPTPQSNVYYWADGGEMARTEAVDRHEVSLDALPTAVRSAAEKASFCKDSGGALRRIICTVGGVDSATITQQCVRHAYPDQERTHSGKLTDPLLPPQPGNRLSKRQILQEYLNTSGSGRGTHGIQHAARAPSSAAALLDSLLKAPSRHDSVVGRCNHARAVARWKRVPDRMEATGRFSAAMHVDHTRFPEPVETPHAPGLSGQIGYLVDTARTYVLSHAGISAHDFDLGGYQIYTTFRKPAVNALAEITGHQMKRIPTPRMHLADQSVHIGAASIGSDGRIVALYGGPDHLRQAFNDANSALVPIGTAFTPIVYAAALRDGIQLQREGRRLPVSPSTLYDGDDGIAVRTPEGPYWDRTGKIVRMHNNGGRSWGRIPLSTAVANSVDTSIAQLGMDVGLPRVRKAATDAGLLHAGIGALVPAFSLGNSTPSPIRVASAYATFAAGGVHVEPYSVVRVTRSGSSVPMPTPPSRRAFSTEVAGEVGAALQQAAQTGNARAAAQVGDGAAAFSGAAKDGTAAWFAGYHQRLSTAVALFRTDPKNHKLLSLSRLGGGSSPATAYTARIWTDYMKSVHVGLPDKARADQPRPVLKRARHTECRHWKTIPYPHAQQCGRANRPTPAMKGTR